MEIDSGRGPVISAGEEGRKRDEAFRKDSSSTGSCTGSETESIDDVANSSCSISTLGSGHALLQVWPSPQQIDGDATSGIKVAASSPNLAEEALGLLDAKKAENSQGKPLPRPFASVDQQTETHSKMTEEKHSSFSYQKQGTRALPVRQNTMPANKGSLVASRVKQFEELIHSETQNLQPSTPLQKQRSEIIMIKEAGKEPVTVSIDGGEREGFCKEKITGSESKGETPERITKFTASFPVLEENGQSYLFLPESLDNHQKQHQLDKKDCQQSIKPVQGTKHNQLGTMLQRDAAAVKKRSQRKKKPREAGRKNKGWWACKFVGYCCSAPRV